jgi:oligopeptide transport system substrate-binding protein
MYGDIWIDLEATPPAEREAFVNGLLDSEPNRLDVQFRQTLLSRTAGQPLFAVELLRELQERGDLMRDDQGRWIAGPDLNWEALPARVEGVIEQRVAQVEPDLLEILSLAAVEGERFTAQVIAQVHGIDERQLIRKLSQVLDRRHRLIQERGSGGVNGQRLSFYRFRHHLFQRYLYLRLGQAERALLHEEIGNTLEALYGEGRDEIAVQLGQHFLEAGLQEKAAAYLVQAGDRAYQLHSFQEAIDHYRQALSLLVEQGASDRAARAAMKLGLVYHLSLDYRKAQEAYSEGFALWQKMRPLSSGTPLSPAPLSPAPHALRISLPKSSNPLTLDPAYADAGHHGAVIRQLFAGLVELSPEMDVMPDLARAWEVQESGLRYRFELRDDLFWSDGTPIEAADIEYAWKRILDPVAKSPVADLLYDIKGARAFHQGEMADPGVVGVRALDATILLVDLEQPASYFLYLLTHCVTYPVPRHVVERYGEAWTTPDHIVTNGPFKLEEWHQGEAMRFARNPSYHGRFGGNVQQVEVLRTWSTPWELYEEDHLDAGILLWREKAHLRQRPPPGDFLLFLKPFTRSRTRYLAFDLRQSPFNNPLVRKALALAIDREALVDTVSDGDLLPATGGFVPPGMPGYSPGISLPHSPEQARQLLAESGYPDGDDFPVIDFLMDDHNPLGLGHSLQKQWREKLGVETRLQVLPWEEFLKRRQQNPPYLFIASWVADYPDPHNFLKVAVRKRIHWWCESYWRLLAEAGKSVDPKQRMELYQEADRMLMEQAVIVPLDHGGASLLVKPWVKKYPMTFMDFGVWRDVVIEAH